MEKTRLKDLSFEKLKKYITDAGFPAFRAKQTADWLYKKEVSSPYDMKNLPKKLQDYLAENAVVDLVRMIKLQQSSDRTRKYLFELLDGNTVETVFMKYSYGNSVCISSQVGCAMGCSFCASGLPGKIRDLTPGEMLDQIIAAERGTGSDAAERGAGSDAAERGAGNDTAERGTGSDAAERGSGSDLSEKGNTAEHHEAGSKDGHVNHVVIMGSGEPLSNYDNVAGFIRLIHDDRIRGMSLRNITVSTCGLIPQMKKFAENFPQVNLAISLHAADDAVRSSMMPVNKRYHVADVIEAAREIAEKTGRRITFEYALVKGVNDSDEDARLLASKLRGGNFHVNLIPLNPVVETGMKGTAAQDARRFCGILNDLHIQATVRRELGRDIDAACGQLRNRELQSGKV